MQCNHAMWPGMASEASDSVQAGSAILDAEWRGVAMHSSKWWRVGELWSFVT